MKPFPMVGYWIALAVIVVLSNIPFAFTAYATSIAEQHGCTISAGFISECIVDGADKSAELHQMAASGLYVLFTWPLGILAFVVWLVLLLRHRGRWKRVGGLA
jgi:hypothetical protein